MGAVWRALPALFLLAAPATAWADERILHYSSDVRIQPDSSLEVAETIDIRAEHDQINHGIFRDFPTRYQGLHGRRVRINFTFEGATLDGAPVQAATSSVSNGVRIKIGDPENLVAVGEHRYVIHYRATRELGHFKDFDELYWNATGNGWVFPIDIAEVRIRLPSAAPFGQRSFYTGPQGSTASNAEVVDEKPGDITFRTTQPLDSYEGLTVAVAFPKGVVAEPSSNMKLAWWLTDYGPAIVGTLALLGLGIFYFIAWRRAGRDPRAGTVVPLFSPSDELTPAGMRYVTRMSAASIGWSATSRSPATRKRRFAISPVPANRS